MQKKYLTPALIFGALAVFVALPILIAPGQIFLLDLIFPPAFTLSNILYSWTGSSLPVSLLLWALSTVSSVGIAEKFLLLVVLLLPMCSLYALLLQHTRRAYAILGGILFLFNPFMYERFVAGHWFVMLGLAYLPVVLYFLRRCLLQYSYKNTAHFALVFAVYPLVSLHYAYVGMGLVLVYTLVHIASRKREHIFSEKYARHGALFIGIVLIVNSFWITSFLSPESTFQSIDQRDFSTFVTRTDTTIGVYLNVLTLHGFWREGAILPKDLLPLWWIPSLIIFLLAGLGVFLRAQKRDKLALTMLLIAPLTLVLAVGYATPWSMALTRFVSSILPGFTGLRETAKLTGIFVLCYAYFAPIGLQWCVEYFHPKGRRARYVGVVLLSVCAFATSFTIFWGAVGQVATATYPASWKIVDVTLLKEAHGKVLVFPWRGYLEVGWANNAFISNPAQAYFSFPVETAVSINNVIYDKKYGTIFDEYIPLDESPSEVASDIASLKALGVTHVILEKTSDWERYLPVLDDQHYFEVESSEPEIALYRLK